MTDSVDTPSTKPYLVRALYEWCTDNGFTPFIAVQVDESVRVPMEFVKDGEIVLNVSFDATSALKLGNDYIEFKGRFGGVARDILVPLSRVLAIYSRENGQGMAFPMSSANVDAASFEPTESGTQPLSGLALAEPDVAEPSDIPPPQKPQPTGGRPTLTRIK